MQDFLFANYVGSKVRIQFEPEVPELNLLNLVLSVLVCSSTLSLSIVRFRFTVQRNVLENQTELNFGIPIPG